METFERQGKANERSYCIIGCSVFEASVIQGTERQDIFCLFGLLQVP